MKLEHLFVDALQITVISGNLMAANITEQRQTLDNIHTEVKHDLILDLTRLDHMDSSGVGLLVYWYKRLKMSNRTMVLIGLNGQPAGLLRMLRIEFIIGHFKTIEDYLATLPAPHHQPVEEIKHA